MPIDLWESCGSFGPAVGRAMKISGILEALAWTVFAVLLAANSTPIVVFALGAIYGDPASAPAWVLQNLIFVSPLFPLVLGVIAIVRLKFAGENVWARIGLFGKSLPGDVLLGVAAGVAAIGVAVVSLQITARYLDVPPVQNLPVPVHLYFMTLGAIVPGVCEELFFRGMLIKVADAMPKPALIAISAVAFSLWHVATPAYLPHTFLLGLMFGILATATGRLAPAIIAHTVGNSGIGLLFLTGFKVVAV